MQLVVPEVVVSGIWLVGLRFSDFHRNFRFGSNFAVVGVLSFMFHRLENAEFLIIPRG